MDAYRVKPSEPGIVQCLKCPRTFKSPDRLRVRICPRCKRDKERLGLIAESESHVHGIDWHNLQIDYSGSGYASAGSHNGAAVTGEGESPLSLPGHVNGRTVKIKTPKPPKIKLTWEGEKQDDCPDCQNGKCLKHQYSASHTVKRLRQDMKRIRTTSWD